MENEELAHKQKKYSKNSRCFKVGNCKCGNPYYYMGLDFGLCVKCIDKDTSLEGDVLE